MRYMVTSFAEMPTAEEVERELAEARGHLLPGEEITRQTVEEAWFFPDAVDLASDPPLEPKRYYDLILIADFPRPQNPIFAPAPTGEKAP